MSDFPKTARKAGGWLNVVLLLALLYLFMSSINLMGGGFKMMGKPLADKLLTLTSNPFAGLMVGVLTTAIVQSSSLTTSLVVSLVASGQLDITLAVPVIMGANVGTTITSVLVSLSFVGRRSRFRKAFACATMHDSFNFITVALLLPLELSTRVLSKSAQWLADGLSSVTSIGSPTSPVKAAADLLKKALSTVLTDGLNLSDKAAAAIMIVVSLGLIFLTLTYLTRIMRRVLAGRMESIIDRYLFRTPVTALLVGLSLTALVQSSSVTTSLLVPLVTAGVVRIEQAFPYTMGANIGTTVTALLAAISTGNVGGLAIALTHTLFNLSGVAIFFPIRRVRNIPVRIARTLAALTLRSRWFALLYVGTIFFVLPVFFIFVWPWASRTLYWTAWRLALHMLFG